MTEVFEIARFKFLDGVDPAMAAAGVNDFLAGQPGFLFRVLLGPDTDGVYTDLVRWRSLEDAQQAMAAMQENAETAAFMMTIDPTTVQMSHMPVVIG